MTGPDFASIEPALAAHGIVLDAARRESLVRYAALLEHWNRRINLVGTRDRAALWQRHLLDCLMLETVPRDPALRSWVDVGSGGGLPAVVLAIVHPDLRITAVETVAKKASFLQEAARQLGLANLTCERRDVWQLAAAPGFTPFDALVARAFGPLADLLALGRLLLRPAGEVWAMKGRRWEEEAAQLPPDTRLAFAPSPAVHPYALGGGSAGVILVYRRLVPAPTAA